VIFDVIALFCPLLG